MATLQKLLWCQEYCEFRDEVVLVEGRFVLEKKHGECLCMVHAGLTETVVLIAEEWVDSDKECLKTPVVSKDSASNVEYLHLAHLFPLQGTKLSTRRHQEHRGEHVLRLRLSTGKTWYLELAEGRHREDRWREWLAWIHDTDEKRNERRHHQKGIKPILAEHTQNQGRSKSFPNTGSDDAIHSTDSGAATRHDKKRRESRAYHWVGHFQGALSRDHEDEVLAKDPNTPYIGLPGAVLDPKNDERNGHSHVSLKHDDGHGLSTGTQKMDHTSSLVWGEPHSLPAVQQASNSSTDAYSSLLDIESLGSLLGDSGVDWKHPVSREINQKLLLCVGDLFQKFNMEAHGHGHVGRWRPVASMTAVDQLKTPAICKTNGESIFFPTVQEKETIYHRCSLPDILEGEASFLDDLHKAAADAHRTSLVYMDLLNEDDNKKPHVINGHVMLLSPEQTRLQEEITRSRETAQDLEFVVAGHDGIAMGARKEVEGNSVAKNHSHGKRRKSLAECFKHKLHLRKRVQKSREDKGAGCQKENKNHSKGILNTIKKVNISREHRGGSTGSSIRSRGITSIKDIPPELLAIELALIDSSLFVRVREAELVDCQWLKGDKHSRAPHTSKFIKFFERVVGLVSTEILLLKTVGERAATMARFVEVAERCRLMQNFHSLKAVLCGMKVLPIYRLKNTWKAFEEEFSYEFELWEELVTLMTDDGKNDQYKMAVEKSMRSQPCLPFFGVFVLQVVDLYSTVDRAGMRERKFVKVAHHSTSSQNSSQRDDVTATSPAMISSRPTNQKGFFGAFASAWSTVRHPPGKEQHTDKVVDSSGTETGMTKARKAHIQKLVINYAKSCAEERGITWRAETPKDTLGAALWAGLDGLLDWGNLFAKVQPTGSTTPPTAEEEEEEKRKKTAEYELYETFFKHQIAAVQYRYESNRLVRNYLLKTSYNTQEQNHRLSMGREPPSD
ncbi:uncharacterized protein LOC117294324 [Asterias rubens]|uniref:uncharacterized protein LOC117294324 n=1 Tax=Asterias rubens TaxID=7604 RepID=UPI00145506D5|nr:uncharacterized protein LOC117294324 [Asterias rubens]